MGMPFNQKELKATVLPLYFKMHHAVIEVLLVWELLQNRYQPTPIIKAAVLYGQSNATNV